VAYILFPHHNLESHWARVKMRRPMVSGTRRRRCVPVFTLEEIQKLCAVAESVDDRHGFLFHLLFTTDRRILGGFFDIRRAHWSCHGHSMEARCGHEL